MNFLPYHNKAMIHPKPMSEHESSQNIKPGMTLYDHPYKKDTNCLIAHLPQNFLKA